MIAGLMRKGKEFAGKEVAGRELGVVEGTTRISADPVAVCCFYSLNLFSCT